jgi:hypothetical protein
MKRSVLPFLLPVLFLTGCSYFPKDDQHPDVPFFEEIIKDKKLFEPIAVIPDNNSERSQLFFLSTGNYLLLNRTYDEVKGNTSDDAKQIPDHRSSVSVEIRNLNSNLVFKETGQTDRYNPVVVDKNVDLYFNGFRYFAPGYTRKEAMPLISISDSLFARTSGINTSNIDSLKRVHLAILEKKYAFKSKDNEDYTVSNGRLILFSQSDFIIDAKQKTAHFDEFDDPVLVEYRNDNRAFPNSYYYYYYSFGKIKFKYDDGAWGRESPLILQYGGQTYLSHPKFGLYRIKKSGV